MSIVATVLLGVVCAVCAFFATTRLSDASTWRIYEKSRKAAKAAEEICATVKGSDTEKNSSLFDADHDIRRLRFFARACAMVLMENADRRLDPHLLSIWSRAYLPGQYGLIKPEYTEFFQSVLAEECTKINRERFPESEAQAKESA